MDRFEINKCVYLYIKDYYLHSNWCKNPEVSINTPYPKKVLVAFLITVSNTLKKPN